MFFKEEEKKDIKKKKKGLNILTPLFYKGFKTDFNYLALIIYKILKINLYN
jgi:hypothetical protein